jgi:hypothetical protein
MVDPMPLRLTPKTLIEIGAREGESMRAYVARLVACPKCASAHGLACRTNTGRNHSERVHAAILHELRLWASTG